MVGPAPLKKRIINANVHPVIPAMSVNVISFTKSHYVQLMFRQRIAPYIKNNLYSSSLHRCPKSLQHSILYLRYLSVEFVFVQLHAFLIVC